MMDLSIFGESSISTTSLTRAKWARGRPASPPNARFGIPTTTAEVPRVAGRANVSDAGQVCK